MVKKINHVYMYMWPQNLWSGNTKQCQLSHYHLPDKNDASNSFWHKLYWLFYKYYFAMWNQTIHQQYHVWCVNTASCVNIYKFPSLLKEKHRQNMEVKCDHNSLTSLPLYSETYVIYTATYIYRYIPSHIDIYHIDIYPATYIHLSLSLSLQPCIPTALYPATYIWPI